MLPELDWKPSQGPAHEAEVPDAWPWALHERREVPLRSAAYGLAVQRVAEASVIRGLYP